MSNIVKCIQLCRANLDAQAKHSRIMPPPPRTRTLGFDTSPCKEWMDRCGHLMAGSEKLTSRVV